MSTHTAAPSLVPEVEVLAKAARRRFSQEYKRKILKEAERCRQPGEIGALLRREGLYSSHLSAWRAARDRGELGGAGLKKRGPQAQPEHPDTKRVKALERENERLRARAERAEGLVELQKKVAALLENESTGEDGRR
jgi:transposase-like protein